MDGLRARLRLIHEEIYPLVLEVQAFDLHELLGELMERRMPALPGNHRRASLSGDNELAERQAQKRLVNQEFLKRGSLAKA